jgi:acyl-CoA synthetase (AMP-forming)/AMP-acid ligase II
MSIIHSPYPNVGIPAVSLPELVLGEAERWGDKPALIDAASGRTITYRQLCESVRRAVGGLTARGFSKGDVLAIYSPNVPEYAIAFYAVARLGGVSTTVNPLYTSAELARQLVDCHARYLVTMPSFLDRAREAAREVPSLEEVFVFGEAEGATPFAALLEGADAPPEVAIDPDLDLVSLPYSSGTTGLPKGVMLTHRNLVANITQMGAVHLANENDVSIAVLPFYHIYGLVVVLSAGLHSGGTIITMPRFDLEAFLEAMQRYRVTIGWLVPPLVLALAKHPLVDKYDLSSLRLAFSGAAPLSEDLAQTCADRLGCEVRQGYGMTETSPVTHCAPPAGATPKAGSVGVGAPNTETRLVDLARGADVEVGEVGEVWVRGPQVMKGYLNQPAATAEMIDPDGWLHTGDLGRADTDGYLYIVDRVKELIKYKGLQVAPAELEALLLTHPSVVDAAVIPSPDQEAGEIPKAFVVVRAPVPADELMAFVAERVAPHKRIRLLEFVDAVPKSASGKILRRELIERERLRVGTASGAGV